MNIQDLKSNTTWQEASNTINNNNNKISLAIATLENAKLKNKGYFTTEEKLNEAIPNPSVGSKAYVGTSEPYAIYIVENGAWVDSGYTGGDEIVAKITTHRIEDGAVTSEKIATSAFDDTLSVSGKIAPADVVGKKLTDLEDKVDEVVGGVNEVIPLNKGAYSGETLIDSSSYKHTEVIELGVGETIVVKTDGANFSVILDADKRTTIIGYAASSTDGVLKEYVYTATSAINVIVSVKVANVAPSITITKGSALEDISKGVEQNRQHISKVEDSLIQITGINEEITCNIKGAYAGATFLDQEAYRNSGVLSVKKGSIINVKTDGANFSVILDADKKKSILVANKDNDTIGDYAYLVPNDMNVIVSVRIANNTPSAILTKAGKLDVLDEIDLVEYPTNWIENEYINANGVFVKFTPTSSIKYWRTDFIPCHKAKQIKFNCSVSGTSLAFCFYKKDKSLLEAHTNSGTRFIDITLDIPSDAYYFATTSRTLPTETETSNINVLINLKTILDKASDGGVATDNIDHLRTTDENPMDIIRFDVGLSGIIHDWGFIGDSLCSGEIEYYKSDGKMYRTDMYQFSWGQRLCRHCGTEGYNFSNGGQTAKGWIEAGVVRDETYEGGVGGGGWQYAKLHPKQAYIIALGVNDMTEIGKGTLTLGNVATDIGTYNAETDSDTNAKTFVGYMAGIIQRLKSIQPKAKIFIFTMPASGTVRNDANAQIRLLASTMGLYVIDFDRYAPSMHGSNDFKDRYFCDGNGHLNEAGYEWTSWAVANYIDWIIRHNWTDFYYTSLIGKIDYVKH